MKGFGTGVMMATATIGVFGASVVGLLAVAGRLNPEGVKEVPVLNRILALPEEGEGDIAAEEASGKKEKDSGKEEKKDQERKPGPSPKTEQSLIGADRIRRKKIFTLRSFAPPTTREEILEFHRAAKDLKERLEGERAALKKKEYELSLREADLEERRKSVRKAMEDVLRRIDELKALRSSFENDITVLKTEEMKNVKKQATALSLMAPEKASSLLLRYLPDREDLAVKILVSMEAEPAAQVLESMDPDKGARLIERATRVLRKR